MEDEEEIEDTKEDEDSDDDDDDDDDASSRDSTSESESESELGRSSISSDTMYRKRARFCRTWYSTTSSSMSIRFDVAGMVGEESTHGVKGSNPNLFQTQHLLPDQCRTL